jgi:curli production assembly/transport component CsgF
MVHTFRDPSFGGNPFNSEHLLAIAGFDRPAQSTPTTSPEDLLASQLRAQLTSSLSSSILTTIQTAKPGDTGSFTVGSQVISFARTATETTVTFTNTRTGEVSTLVIPVSKTTTPSPFGASPSGESALIGVSQSASQPPLVNSGAVGLEVSLGPPPL